MTASSFLSRSLVSSLTGLTLLVSPTVSALAANSVPAQGVDTSRLAQIPEAGYSLGAGDRIRIDIFRVPQYSGEHEILIDGSVTLPVAGRVNLLGLTPDQAAAAVRAAYSNILRQPRITVVLLAPRPLRIGIAGEVATPGSYTVERTGAQFPTITSLLEKAGGVTQLADLRQVQIYRPRPTGGNEFITVDLWQLVQTGDLQYDVTLRDGDSVFVPTATALNLTEALQLSSASFAADESRPLNIAVVGEVFRPGPYTVTGTARTGAAGVPGGGGGTSIPPTVTRAIQVAGGIKPLADVREIQVQRQTRTGTQQTIAVDLWQLLQQGDLTQDIVLQEGDTVVVPTADGINSEEAAQLASASFSPDTVQVNVVGEVTSPGIIRVPPNTPLNQGLLAAGGFNNRASQGEVDLVRLNPNGTVERRTVDVNFAEGADSDSNPTLRNNDVIIVSRSTAASIGDTLDNIARPISSALSLLTLPFTLLRLF
ncbi:MAG: sugar ABC transporter substrate-binding protein [Leptolyngbya sp. SIO4C5]|uniref:SLBB domain-containing protein n=1 Tax=Sphaerothrix gracilis TaxID=3151835 RepID=UPI0013BF1C27|nr:sugar ABC transporter substrate-binding protein [Leptolyngbya sp. SIO4C5]